MLPKTIYIENIDTQPDFNIALEEYCFRHLSRFDNILLLWRNRPSVIIGKYQNVLEEINSEYVRRNKIPVIRRISGGGAVYQDLNNINFTFISNVGTRGDYNVKSFFAPIVNALSVCGIDSAFSPRNDLLIEGRKICGSAQAYTSGRLMHHSCLLFDTDLSKLSQALKTPNHTIICKGAKSVRSEVDNIRPYLASGTNVDQFMNEILHQTSIIHPSLEEYKLEEEELNCINNLREARFGRWEWNFGYSPRCDIIRQKSINNNLLTVSVKVDRCIISEIEFHGDVSIDQYQLDYLVNMLKGTKYMVDAVKQTLTEYAQIESLPDFSVEEWMNAIVE